MLKFDSYEGEFKNNLFHGKGKYEWSDGRSYEGDWVEGKMEGDGEFSWKGNILVDYNNVDGKKYVGKYL